MKKIGITTSTQSFSENYGAILQAYALSYKLKKLGYNPYIIKYKRNTEFLKNSAPVLMRLKATLLSKNYSFYAKKEMLKTKFLGKTVSNLFEGFAKNNLQFYNNTYLDFDSLKNDPPKCDAFITGSDQVWNPVIHENKNDPGFFLDFVPEGKKRIAYAPSMGVSEIPDICKKDLKYYLEKFDSLSIREKSGSDIIKKVCDIDVPVVLDPTLLLDQEEWNEVCKKPDFLPDEYILCYKFGNKTIVEKAIKKISLKYRLPVVAIPASYETRFPMDYRIGPNEFIGAIKHAKIICTDSFHATVFSIIYNKPFLTFPRHAKGAKGSMNSRMKGILDTLGLDSRYIDYDDIFDMTRIFDISYDKANDKLKELQDESVSYLSDALREI